MKKILVANRGEIAIRIMRSAKEMGIKTVAVYSDADRQSPHVMYADQAVHIGPSPSSESYLKMDKIIEVCKDLDVDAIHPGYGFLSENAEFARKVEKENIVFIGPSALAMEMMGNKLKAKETVKKFNVPMVPGTDEKLTDVSVGKSVAKEIGYPILIKAAAGGGGKGMRVVEQESQFEEQMNLAISEAISSFGDGSVFIERYVGSPRHIEIQILADKHGNVVHLFERECSVQRRHQKVVEEAPSSVLDDALREEMGQCAISVAKSCDYVGAGTVEFLLDENNDFYFLEMNTRLQVEHPVTELITSVDLVKEQIKVAQGQKLSFSQDDIAIKGHAVEVRVYAEDPFNNFSPDIGILKTYKLPDSIGVRVDNGFEQGMEIPIFYDSMLCKLITYGKNRQEAIDRMVRAIDDFTITGVITTLPFGKFVMENEHFKSGNFDTHFVKNHFDSDSLDLTNEKEAKIAGLLAKHLIESNSHATVSNGQLSNKSNWKKNRF
ncbi:MAG: acetyl-CoA carboxylase biotin carboxylase subunit [Flavobacteriales bacterium]|mgnify:CR=1 FL=1|jgi:acetyl-CoA carboxylase biotin carboxylase subunit|tara:strand:+ start:10716 stop:12194 length:1479 start_codon:yes stop_codon:yes gene_type:complete